jgi:hypothetical protein
MLNAFLLFITIQNLLFLFLFYRAHFARFPVSPAVSAGKSRTLKKKAGTPPDVPA